MRYFVQRTVNYFRDLFGNPWKDAVIEALVVDHILASYHEDDPRRALNDLLAWEQQVALDPRMSSSAAELIQRGHDAAIAAFHVGQEAARGEQCEHGWYGCKRCAPAVQQEPQ